MKTPVAIAWSGGKDSAMMLGALLASGKYEPACLLTTVTEGYDRIAMHGVRRSLLEAQAQAIGLELMAVEIPQRSDNGTYESRMREACESLKARGISTVAFGDLFLEDVRAYREKMCAEAEMTPLYPVWGENTAAFARRFIAEGYRAAICCIDTHALPPELAGAEYDAAFLRAIEGKADPCGENGEFHSFVYAAPYFRASIVIVRGQRVLRENRFSYCDLLPA